MQIQIPMDATAAVKSADSYNFYNYEGKINFLVSFRNSPVAIEPGFRFGLRPSSNGKSTRLIIGKDESRVITITEAERAVLLERSVSASKTSLRQSAKEDAAAAETKAFAANLQVALVAVRNRLLDVSVPTKGYVDAISALAKAMPTKTYLDADVGSLTKSQREKLLTALDQVMKMPLGSQRLPANPSKEQKIALQIFKNARTNSHLLGSIAKNLVVAEDSGLFDICIGVNDAADHAKLAHMIYTGDKKAAKKASYLDTTSRDMIPTAAWNWIENNLR